MTTPLDEKAEHPRIWLEPAGAPDRCWCEDNQWGDEGVEYVLATSADATIKGLEAEVERLRAIVAKDPKTLMIAYEDGDHMRLSRAAANERKRAELAEIAENEAKDCFWAIYPRYLELGGAPVSTELARTELVQRAEAAEAELDALRKALAMPDKDRRQWFIGDQLDRLGYLNRADLVAAFGISVPQASTDIQAWLAANPGAAVYNSSAKRYEATGGLNAPS